MTKITNSDLLARLERLEARFNTMDASLRSEIGSFGSIVMKLNEKATKEEAVREYLEKQQSSTLMSYRLRNTKTWIEVGKQLTIILGIISAILYAYFQTRGINK